MNKKNLNKALKRFKVFTWVLFVLMFIQSCFLKNAQALTVGVMLLMMSFVFLPCEEKISDLLHIKLNIKNKLFMLFIIFNITSIFIYQKDNSYYYPLLTFLFSLLSWFLLILFKKRKNS